MAWSKIDDTCPDVDAAFDQMVTDIKSLPVEDFSKEVFNAIIEECIDKVKDQTTALRDALIETCSEYLSMEEELRDRIEELEDQISKME